MPSYVFDIDAGRDDMNPVHEDYPHLTVEQWEALKRLSHISGSTVQWLLTQAPHDVQREAAQQFLERELLATQQCSTPAPQAPATPYSRQHHLKVDDSKRRPHSSDGFVKSIWR
jgi:hypothetical protein